MKWQTDAELVATGLAKAYALDSVRKWLAAEAPAGARKDPRSDASGAQVYAAFLAWQAQAGRLAIDRRALYVALASCGIGRYRTGKGLCFTSIRLLRD